MCPGADGPVTSGTTPEEMVAIETTAPALPPPTSQTNGHSEPPSVKSHKKNGAGSYSRASDFLSNTSNWKVSVYGWVVSVKEVKTYVVGCRLLKVL